MKNPRRLTLASIAVFACTTLIAGQAVAATAAPAPTNPHQKEQPERFGGKQGERKSPNPRPQWAPQDRGPARVAPQGGAGSVTINFPVGATGYVVPPGVTKIDVSFAGGGGGGNVCGGGGGRGGFMEGTLNVTPGEVLQVNVGGIGGWGGSPWAGQGGWNGGGTTPMDYWTYATGGGGATDLRTGSFDLADRILVAGGGGGAGTCSYGGNGNAAANGAGGAGDSGDMSTGGGGAVGLTVGAGGEGEDSDLDGASGSGAVGGSGGNGGDVPGGAGGGGYAGGGGGGGIYPDGPNSSAGGAGSSYVDTSRADGDFNFGQREDSYDGIASISYESPVLSPGALLAPTPTPFPRERRALHSTSPARRAAMAPTARPQVASERMQLPT